MTPMGTNDGEQNGEMSFLHIDYYDRQRAKGGTGLIIVENASVDSPYRVSDGTTQLRIDHGQLSSHDFTSSARDVHQATEQKYRNPD